MNPIQVSTHQVTLVTPDGSRTLQCAPSLSILDSAAAQGLVLPAVCRGGACSACIGKLIDGIPPDQSEQSYLSDEDLDNQFVLLCAAYPLGDCTLSTHQTAAFLATVDTPIA